MKKSIALYAVFALALGIILIATGIAGCCYLSAAKNTESDETENLIVFMLVHGISFIFTTLFALCILLGLLFLIFGASAPFAFYKNDPYKLQRILRRSGRINVPLLVLIILYDLTTIGSFFRDWNDTPSVIVNLTAILITALTVATQIAGAIALKNVNGAPQ